MKRARIQDYPRALPIIAALVWALLVGVELLNPALADPQRVTGGSMSSEAMTSDDDSICATGADLDSDGRVDAADLFNLLSQWGPFGDDAACPADLDGDGGVDAGDIVSLLSEWGEISNE